MPKTNRGWSMGRQCKPAAEYDMRVARGLLQRESARWPAYAIVTTPSAYAAAQEYLVREPAGVVFAEWLDSAHQQDLSGRLPAGIEMVIGLGGGKALDASKFVALGAMISTWCCAGDSRAAGPLSGALAAQANGTGAHGTAKGAGVCAALHGGKRSQFSAARAD